MHGARLLVRSLEECGVEYAFGLAGSVILGILDEIAQSDISFVTTRHEQTAAGMATGYAMATRRPTVSISHVGPGAANQIIGVASAYRENVPVIAITGNEPSYHLGRHVRHEWDVLSIFERFTKANVRITRDDPRQQLRHVLTQALTGVPGPVHIDFPRDLEEAELSLDETDRPLLPASEKRASMTPAQPTPASVSEAADLLEMADRPVVIAGSELRWFDGAEHLRRLAETLELPVVNEQDSRGAFPETHELSVGFAGSVGFDAANEYLQAADLILGIGTRFSDLTTDDWTLINDEATIIHVTLQGAEFGRNYGAAINSLSDPASFLAQLQREFDRRDASPSFGELATEARRRYEEEWTEAMRVDQQPTTDLVDPRTLVAEIHSQSDEIVITTGGGVHAQFPRALRVDHLNGSFATPNFSGMSQGFPLALGAQLALDKQVITFEGDGGFAMVMQDLETAVRESIPVKICVLNNNSYMSQKVRQERFYGERFTGSTFDNPNFADIANTFGMFGEQVTSNAEVEAAVNALLTTEGPGLLDVLIDPHVGTGGAVYDDQPA